MLYQFNNSLRGDTVKILCGRSIRFQPHLHNSFELVAAKEKGLHIRVDGNDYMLDAGKALLIFPNQIHEYVEAGADSIICIFSPEIVSSYSSTLSQYVPESNLFTPPNACLSALSDLQQSQNVLLAQGLLYLLCGVFHETAMYVRRPDRDCSLIEKIFRFVDSNHKGDCTLEALAAHTSYNYSYLSKYFKQYTGIRFIEYVNHYRVNEARFLLRYSNKTILSVALECGFDSLRNFNRIFKKIAEQTPSEYRRTMTMM